MKLHIAGYFYAIFADLLLYPLVAIPDINHVIKSVFLAERNKPVGSDFHDGVFIGHQNQLDLLIFFLDLFYALHIFFVVAAILQRSLHSAGDILPFQIRIRRRKIHFYDVTARFGIVFSHFNAGFDAGISV
jgi:hypothetical protein